MKNFNQDIITMGLFVIEFTLLFFGCVFLYQLNPQFDLLFPIAVGCSVWIMTYSVMAYLYRRKLNKTMAKAVKLLSNFYNDDEVQPNNSGPKDLIKLNEKYNEIKIEYKKNEEVRGKTLDIIKSTSENIEINKLLEDILPKLIEITGSNCSAFYTANSYTNKLEITYSIGFSKNIYKEFDLPINEGFIGTNLKDNETKVITDIPDDTIYIMRTFLGNIKPKSLMVVPIAHQEKLLGVFVFVSVKDYSSEQVDMLNILKIQLSTTIANCVNYGDMRRLTNELKFQNNLIQNLNEDLEGKIQQRTVFLRDLIDSLRDYAVYAFDKNGTILVWNKCAEELFGFFAADVIGKNIFEMNFNNDYELSNKKKIHLTVKNGKYIDNGWRKMKDGTDYYAESIIFALYNTERELTGFTNVTKNSTSYKKLENNLWFETEFLSKLIDSDIGLFAFTNAKGVIQKASKQLKAEFGIEDLSGKKISSFFEDSVVIDENLEYLASAQVSGTVNGRLMNNKADVVLKVQTFVDINIEDKNLFIFINKH